MNHRLARLFLFASALLALPAWAAADDRSDPSISHPPSGSSPAPTAESLLRQLQQQNERIEALERRLASQAPAPASAASAPAQGPAVPATTTVKENGGGSGNAVRATFGDDGFTLRSADGANAIHLRGNLSVDGRDFSDAYTPATAGTFLLRRARPTIEGTLQNLYDFRLMPDFAQGKAIIQDAWVDARIAPGLVLTAGKFKAPVGLERLQLEQFGRFIEVGLPSDLMPYRDLGVDVGGTLDHGVFSYAAGLFDGTLDGGSADGNASPDLNTTGRFSWAGRVFSKPFVNTEFEALNGFGLGIAATYVNASGTTTATTTSPLLASYKSPGQQPMFSYRTDTVAGGTFNNATVAHGIERRLNPQFYYYFRSLGLLGEYVKVGQQVSRLVAVGNDRTATLEHDAWQLQAAYFLTGEREAYDSNRPRHDFCAGQPGFGAWELVARIHEIHFDPGSFSGGAASFANPLSSVSAARALGVGVNWYLNANFRMQLDYDVTRYENGSATGIRPSERALISQFALVY